jgi:hypothetical protein
LPPVLRVASLLRLLFPLGLFATLMFPVTASLWTASARMGIYASQVAIIAVNLILLGLACGLVVRAYNARVRQPVMRPFPLDSWQSQARAILALAALPVCALVLAVVIPPTASVFQIVFAVSLLGAIVFLVVALSTGIARETRG